MDPTKATKHDERRHPAPAREVPQGRTYGPRQPEHFFESPPPLDRYLGNNYVQALAGKKQRLQTKLKVNESGDSYEQEADRLADQLLATPAHHQVSNAPPRIQRFSGQSHGQVDAAPASVDQALASPGRALGLALRQDMEERFGFDFANVRVHTGAAAEQSTEDVNAHAYTMGHDIVFGAGRLAPETHAGRSLLAHELTHVVHQAERGMPSIQRKEKEGQHNWVTVTQITVEPKTIGRGRGRALTSDGQTLAINIEVNNLSAGRMTAGKPLQEPKADGWSRIHLGSMGANRLVYLLPPGVTVAQTMTIVVEPAFRERQIRDEIKGLAPHIQNFLMENIGEVGSYEDLQSVANAGFILETAGVTEDELELSLLELPKGRTSDLAGWALTFVEPRAEQEQIEKEHEEREQRREAEEKELEKWRKRFAKYPDVVLDKKITELRKEPESGSAKDWLPRYEKERARRRDVRRAQPVTRPETVDQAVSMLEEAWRDAEKEDVPDVKRALELVSHIDEWLQETASSDKYDRFFKDGMFRTVARQTVGMTKDQIHTMRFKLRRQGEDNWNRPTHLGGHWELGVNSLKAAREYLEVMGAKKTLQETSLHGLQEASSRATKYAAAGYAAVILAPVVIGAGIKAAPFLTTHALTGAGLRVAPRLMLWAGRHPVFATAIGTGVAETVLQVGQDKYLDPFQLIFSLLHIYTAMPGRGTPAPNAPRPQGEPEFIITGTPKVDQQTGKVTASAIEQSTGRRLDAEVDVTTGLGRVTDGKTGQVVGNIDLTTADIGRQAPSPAVPPPASIAPAPTLTASQGGGQGSGAARGMLRDVDVSGPGVQVPASHTVFKNKPVANDAPAPGQSQVSKVAVNAPNDVSQGQITGVQPSAPAQKNVAPVSMVTKPPPSNPPGDTGASPRPAARPTSSPAGTSAGRTPAVHPRVIPRPVRTQAPAQPEVLPAAPEIAPPPAPRRQVNQNVIPKPPAEPAPPPEVVPPAPARAVNENVIPRRAPLPAPPEPEVAPSARPRPSATRTTEFDENEPTQVDLEPPSGHDVRGSVRPAGGGPSPAGVDIVSGEITETPAVAPRRNTTVSPPEKSPAAAAPEPHTGPPQPVVRQPAVSSEPSAPAARVTKTPQTLDRFDFQSLPVPEQHKGARDKVQIFGTRVINWGAGPKEAQALTTMLQTNPNAARAYIENLRGQGVTREMARAWADAYRHEHQRAKIVARTHRVPVNETPESRVTLMDLIAGLL